MGFIRPLLTELVRRITTDLVEKLELPETTPSVSVVRTIGTVLAGLSETVHSHIDYVLRQISPITCDTIYLNDWLKRYGLIRKPPTTAEGVVEILGSGDSFIPIGLEMIRNDGELYETISNGELRNGVIRLVVRSKNPGDKQNCEDGRLLRLTETHLVLNGDVIVRGGISGGSDEEKDDSALERLLVRLQNPPQGGSIADYKGWATSIKNVKKAHIYPKLFSPNSVGVMPISSSSFNPIVTESQLAEIKEYINARRPVTADVTVFLPKLVFVKLRIRINSNNPDVRSRVARLVSSEISSIDPYGTIDYNALASLVLEVPGLTKCLISQIGNAVAIDGTSIFALAEKDISWT